MKQKFRVFSEKRELVNWANFSSTQYIVLEGPFLAQAIIAVIEPIRESTPSLTHAMWIKGPWFHNLAWKTPAKPVHFVGRPFGFLVLQKIWLNSLVFSGTTVSIGTAGLGWLESFWRTLFLLFPQISHFHTLTELYSSCGWVDFMQNLQFPGTADKPAFSQGASWVFNSEKRLVMCSKGIWSLAGRERRQQFNFCYQNIALRNFVQSDGCGDSRWISKKIFRS